MDVASLGDAPRVDTLAATAPAGSSGAAAPPDQPNTQPSKQVNLIDMLAHYHEYFQKLHMDMQVRRCCHAHANTSGRLRSLH